MDFHRPYLEKIFAFGHRYCNYGVLATAGCAGPSHSMSQARVVARSTDLFKPSQFCTCPVACGERTCGHKERPYYRCF